jgi:predicted nucleotidyltransferase
LGGFLEDTINVEREQLMELQSDYVQKLQAAVVAEPRIKAAWLTGSLGRGNADRYSDIDLNLWLDAANLDQFRQETEKWLNELRPLVLFTWMFHDRMANSLTVDGLRIDLWLHTHSAPMLDESRVQILLDRDDALQFGTIPMPVDATALKNRLIQQIREFWRCISLLPAVIGRDERIVTLVGLTVEVNILTDVLISGYGIAHDSGVKRLNPFLPEEARLEIENALAFSSLNNEGLTNKGLADAHLALAQIMQEQGRQLATRHGFEYPTAVEDAVLQYTLNELTSLGIVDAEQRHTLLRDSNE